MNEVKSYLEAASAERPQQVIRRLNVGDVVHKNPDFSYVIDDVDVMERLGGFPRDAMPYGLIHKALLSSEEEVARLFENSGRIPFSRVVEAGVGCSLEKAILMQIHMRGRYGFLVRGMLKEGKDLPQPYSWNVTFTNGNPFLIDVERPLHIEFGKFIAPFVPPIVGVEEGIFLLPDNWGVDRVYSLS